jgi:hypothetical protein
LTENLLIGPVAADALKQLFNAHRYNVSSINNISFSSPSRQFHFRFSNYTSPDEQEEDYENEEDDDYRNLVFDRLENEDQDQDQDDDTDDDDNEYYPDPEDSDVEEQSHRKLPENLPSDQLVQLFQTVRSMDTSGMTRKAYRMMHKAQPSMLPDYLVQAAKFTMEDLMQAAVPISVTKFEIEPESLSTTPLPANQPAPPQPAPSQPAPPPQPDPQPTSSAEASPRKPKVFETYSRSVKQLLTHILTKEVLDTLFGGIPRELRVLNLKVNLMSNTTNEMSSF